MRTTIRLDAAGRDALARLAERGYGGASLDETVARLAFEHESFTALTRLSDDELQEYQDEQWGLVESDTSVPE